MNYIKYSCIVFLWENVWIIPDYILLTRNINTFCKVLAVYVVLAYFESKIHKDVWAISRLHVANFLRFKKRIDTFWSGGIRTFCPLGHILGLGVSILRYFVLKYQKKKIDKIHKDFWAISSIHAQFFVPKCLNIPKFFLAYKKYQHTLIWKYE